MDGFRIEFYSKFWSKLAPLFMQITRYMSSELVLLRSMYHTVISVVLKPGEAGESPSDYKQISLTNSDNKTLTKVISNRLAKVLPDLIHVNQTGFIKNRHLQANTRTRSGIIQYAKKAKYRLISNGCRC